MSVPDSKLDPPAGDDCFDCLVEEIGYDAACDTQEATGDYGGICPKHRGIGAAMAAEDRADEERGH